MQPTGQQHSETAEPAQAHGPARLICPYCGSITHLGARCEHCRGPLDPLSRQATQNTMGPWFIRDEANPFRPGCSFETIRSLVARSKIGPDTIVRGPTTRQFWCAARRAPGVAHLVGVCPDCGIDVQPTDTQCDECGADFVIDADRQYLGLAPIAPLPGQPIAEPAASSAINASPAALPRDDRAAALERTRRTLFSTRSALRWVWSTEVTLFIAVLAVGVVAVLAARRGTQPSASPAAPPQPAPAKQAAPIKLEPAPEPAPASKSEENPPQQAAPADAEQDRAKRLLAEGTPQSLTQAIKLAEAAKNAADPTWISIKEAAERRLAQLKLRSLR